MSKQLGFFTDTSLCIGCKACEVACKEWNQVPASNQGFTGMSYDNTIDLGADTWRHVAFVEQVERADQADQDGPNGMRWLMSSDVCKHCAHAACLDVCPTGALFRTEFDTVVVQPDICNGCGYCVPACPFGVIDRREDDGRAFKCTLCYDRLKDDRSPRARRPARRTRSSSASSATCATAPSERLEELHAAGEESAQLYLHDEADGIGGAHAFFLLLDEPEVYGLPPDPVDTTRDLGPIWSAAGAAALALGAGIAAAVFGGRS